MCNLSSLQLATTITAQESVLVSFLVKKRDTRPSQKKHGGRRRHRQSAENGIVESERSVLWKTASRLTVAKPLPLFLYVLEPTRILLSDGCYSILSTTKAFLSTLLIIETI